MAQHITCCDIYVVMTDFRLSKEMKNGFMMKKEEELQQQELSLHDTVYITYGDIIMLMTDILRKCRCLSRYINGLIYFT